MHSVTFTYRDNEGNIVDSRTINLELRVSPEDTGFKFEILNNGTDVVAIQPYDPTKGGYEIMTEEEATKYGTITMARMLTDVPQIHKAMSGWGDSAFFVALEVLKETLITQ